MQERKIQGLRDEGAGGDVAEGGGEAIVVCVRCAARRGGVDCV